MAWSQSGTQYYEVSRDLETDIKIKSDTTV